MPRPRSNDQRDRRQPRRSSIEALEDRLTMKASFADGLPLASTISAKSATAAPSAEVTEVVAAAPDAPIAAVADSTMMQPFANVVTDQTAARNFAIQVARDLALGNYDLNRDGTVNLSDETSAWQAFSTTWLYQYSMSAAERAVFDTNANGTVNGDDLALYRARYLNALDTLSRLDQLRVDALAGRMDFDHDGSADAFDLVFAEEQFNALGTLSVANYSLLRSFADLNNNGAVNSADAAIFRANYSARSGIAERLDRLERGEFDLNNDGRFDLQDLRTIVADHRSLMTGTTLDWAHQDVLDHDRNGALSWNDRDDLLEEIIAGMEVHPFDGLSPTNSDPLGLANGTSVLFVDANNPNARNEGDTGRAVGDYGAVWRSVGLDPNAPLDAFRLLTQLGNATMSQKLLSGDRVYLSGEQATTDEVWISTPNVTFRNYPGKKATLRFGLPFYGVSVQVLTTATDTQWHGIEFVGNIDTPQGKLFALNLFSSSAERTLIDNCIFRDAKGVPTGFLTADDPDLTDIAFGTRRNRDGSSIALDLQGRGNTLQLAGANGSIVRNSFVRTRPDFNMDAISVYGLEYWDTQVQALTGEGILIDQADDVRIEGTRVQHFGHQGISVWNSQRVTLANNDISNGLNTAVALYLTDDSVLDGNRIHDWGYVPRRANAWTYRQTGNGVQIEGASRNRLFRNVFYNVAYGSGAGIQIGSNPTQGDPPTNDNDVYNNTFYNMNVAGVKVIRLTGPYTNPLDVSVGNRNRVYNNIFHNVKTRQGIVLTFSYQLGGVVGNGNQFFNNQISGTGLAVYPFSVTGGATVTNVDLAAFNALSFAENNTIADPLFVDAAALDLRLQSGSTAIGTAKTGTDLYGAALVGWYTNRGAF